ncbi:MAG: polysaccharide biosynthesis tyrosine autokinase [Burkholderiaceae bacterium]
MPNGSIVGQMTELQRIGQPVDRDGEDQRIGAILVSMGALTPDQVERILAVQEKDTKARFGEIAIRLGFVKKKHVDSALAKQFGYSGDLTEVNQLLSPSLVAALNPVSPFAEALRGLRSQLLVRWFDGTPAQIAMAITSVNRGDGKSFITSNLGVIFSQLGERTLIIDADLRHSTQHEIFGLRNRMGLSGVLNQRAGAEEIIQIPGLAGLSVLPAGPVPPNPTELLSRDGFAILLNQLSSHFDVILIDTPSAQEASDALVVASRARGVTIVGRRDSTKSSELTQLASVLRGGGCTIIGATLNDY